MRKMLRRARSLLNRSSVFLSAERHVEVVGKLSNAIAFAYSYLMQRVLLKRGRLNDICLDEMFSVQCKRENGDQRATVVLQNPRYENHFRYRVCSPNRVSCPYKYC